MEIKVSVGENSIYDVIVVGGGAAGCTAAASAAREGAKTLLIEAAYCLGGMGTSGLVPAWAPFSDGEKIIYKGMAENIFIENKNAIPHVKKHQLDWVPIDAEFLKRQFDDLLKTHGVDILFGSVVSSVKADEGTIEYIVCGNKSGLTAYKAKIYIDCTGDGDLAYMAGAPFEKGGESGELQPASLCFILSGVGDNGGERLFKQDDKNSVAYKMLEDKDFPYIDDLHLCNNFVGSHTVGFNAGHVWLDATDPVAVTEAVIRGRKIAYDYQLALKKYSPADFSSACLSSTAALLGVRETRRILGDYYLTVQDYLDQKKHDDDIALNCYYIDVHNKREDLADKLNDFEKATVKYEFYKNGESYGVPYRCLTPRGLKNLLVAGRCISTDRPVQGSVRVMPCCMVVGEAAGTAAAMATNTKDTRKVDTAELRKKLIAYGNNI